MSRKPTLFSFVVSVLLGAGSAYAQKLPHFNHYYYLGSFYNPALVADNSRGSAVIIGRAQWVGYQTTFDYRAGAPLTQQANLSVPMGRWPVALGFVFTNDQLGPLFSRIGQFSTAYRLTLSQQSTLSFGVAGYYIVRGVNFQEYRFVDQSDPLNSNNWESDQNLDFAAGVGYRVGSFSAALALRNLAGVTYDYGFSDYIDQGSTLSTSVLQFGHFFVLSGTSAAPTLSLAPSLMLQSDWQRHYFVDLGGVVEVQRRFRAGFNIRHLEGAAVILGFSFLKDRSFSVSYSSDFIVNNPSAKAVTSQEVLLNYQFSVQREERIPIKNPRFDH